MKNLHLIPTDKPSKLFKANQKLVFDNTNDPIKCISAQHIFITSDEELNKDTKPCWCLDTKNNSVNYYQGALPLHNYIGYKKIILSTDQDLIKDGVQAIDDDFLEWFVKNPSCESVMTYPVISHTKLGVNEYKIIIPKEETLEEAASRLYAAEWDWKEKESFIEGSQCQAKRMYSEEEAGELVYNIIGEYGKNYGIMIDGAKLNELFEQFKKK